MLKKIGLKSRRLFVEYLFPKENPENEIKSTRILFCKFTKSNVFTQYLKKTDLLWARVQNGKKQHTQQKIQNRTCYSWLHVFEL